MEQPGFIPPNPGIRLSWMLNCSLGKRQMPSGDGFLQGHQRIMTYSGSAALSAAAKGLKQIGRDHLLAPSFNCGHEIEPFVREKFELEFYRIDKHGIIDLEDFKSRLHGNRQVALVTHYFGFARNVEIIHDLCRMKGVYFLEDCAHAFLSCVGDRYLGTWGDIAIFSYWKMLPIPDGGCLLLNNPEIPGVPPSDQPRSISVRAKTVKLLIEYLFLKADTKSKLGFEILKKVKGALQLGQTVLRNYGNQKFYSIDDESFNFDSNVLNWEISQKSLQILSKIDNPQDVKDRRRRNYQYVQNALSNLERLQPLFDHLPDGTCPLKFPLVAPQDHSNVQMIMQKYPSVYRWWSHFHSLVPWERFPESQWLKHNCFVIEIHQDMGKKHLDFLIDCVLKADKDMK